VVLVLVLVPVVPAHVRVRMRVPALVLLFAHVSPPLPTSLYLE